MAHELEFVGGKAQMAYVGETPWHRLGTKLPEGVSPEQMMVAAGLDWEVELRKTMYMGNNGEMLETGSNCLVRKTDAKVLSNGMKDGWKPVQNREAFEFFNEFCQAGSMDMNTAGSLKDGQMVWALAKLSDDFELFNGDKVEGFLLFSNPHQLGKTIEIKFTPIRVVCKNTLTMALNGGSTNGMFRMHHRMTFNPETVKETLGLASYQMGEFKKVAEYLGSKKITDKKFREFLTTVFGETEKRELNRIAQTAYDVFETQPGAKFAEGTYWTALNAVTYTMDHLYGRSADSRLHNAWFAGGAKTKLDAMKTALEMA
jgi:phage/plasmid-like protein (TIGR03299 family)